MLCDGVGYPQHGDVPAQYGESPGGFSRALSLLRTCRTTDTSDLRREKEKQDLNYLRQMSWEEDQRTLYHDLLTPHRSYAFPSIGTT